MKKTPSDKTTDTPIAYEPNYAIRRLIGKDVVLAEVFTPEKIESCQKVINDARKDFFADVQDDLNKLKKTITVVAKSSEHGADNLDDIGRTSNNIKGQSEIFGFILVNKICVQIIECCQSINEPVSTRLLLIKELIAALHLAIEHKITDDGGDIGKSLLADLDKYRAKYKTTKF